MSKIERDAFLYLDPSGPDKDNFAQCGTCKWFNADRERCAVLREGDVVKAADSCGYYAEGEATTEDPMGLFTPDEVGFVKRKVRCENCSWFKPGDGCDLYYRLNKFQPEWFDLDTKVDPRGCCNANTEKSSRTKTMELSAFIDTLIKAGARHGKRDREHLEDAHKALAAMVDGVHCVEQENTDEHGSEEMGRDEMERVNKRGARHSKEDLQRIKKAHDLVVQLGAACPGMKKDDY